MKIKTKAVICGLLMGSTGLTLVPAFASSHREAPGIAGMPRVDGTDFYMFRSYEPGKDTNVTLIANYIPIQAPYGGPNYFTLDNDAIYEIHISNDGDAEEEITFQFDFNTGLLNTEGFKLPIGPDGATIDVAIPLRQYGPITDRGDATINEAETYTLTMITGDRRTGVRTTVTGPNTNGSFTKPIDNIGNKSLPDYADYADQHIFPITLPCGSGKVFVGQRAEAFAVNLGAIFDLINIVPIQGFITQSRDNDDLVGEANVTSLALELPITCLTANTASPIIGGWTTASLPQAQLRDPLPGYNATTSQGGAYVQVSRLSAPLVNEVVIGLKDKDLFNAAEPTQDSALATYVTHPTLPALIDILFRGTVNTALGTSFADIAPNNFPRADLQTAFLTGFPGVNSPAGVVGSEMMRLNTSFPVTLRADQQTLGLVAEDLAGFPNGRRPGDDTVDIALRVVMGALCHPVPLGAELQVPGAVENTPSDFVNLGLCTEDNAPVGNQPFTDGAPISASELQNAFPYLNTPLPGARNPT